MKRIFSAESGTGVQPPSKCKKMHEYSSPTLYDDILLNILPFLHNRKEIIPICSLVSKQWFDQCCKLPLSIKLTRGSTLNNLLFKNKLLSNLTQLDASNCYRLDDFVGLECIRELCQCEEMRNLKSLILFANEIDDECCKLIATSPYLKNLTRLDFGESEIREGIEYLANSENCKNLRILKLESLFNANKSILKALAYGKYFTNLTNLEINDIFVDEALDFGQLTQLTSLCLEISYIKNMEPITRNEHFKNLTSLNLCSNSFEREGCKEIANSKYLNQLTYLNLGGCRIGDGIIDIANSPNMSNLSSLIIYHGLCTKQACKYLCESKYITKLTYLDISNNDIGSEGVKMIVDSPNMINLTTLMIDNCGSDDSYNLISHSVFSNQLKIINIDNFDWDIRGKFNGIEKLIFTTLEVANLTEVNLLFNDVFPKLRKIASYHETYFKRNSISGEISSTPAGLKLFDKVYFSDEPSSDEE
ncbi:predicted protein [Naegleria gruberi]|uniref:Predicted protein n=1 Tax=Naegleria gruberi TaxID=5762 RepID=D2W2I7_NAEGR|nr:uncharacterized protein NAEGRDRAFT_75601 [Naegleria gruberi]EFC36753.1 predicted protein [Naegleria gruberi]|eukprot:XP_002669497.1 predicted protein [Naegleria gruberi strain NEG-M]